MVCECMTYCMVTKYCAYECILEIIEIIFIIAIIGIILNLIVRSLIYFIDKYRGKKK